jgi:hypothetical protein
MLKMVLLLLGVVATSPASAQDGFGSDVDLSRVADISDQDKLRYASEAQVEILDALRQVNKLLDGARRDANAEKIQCLTGRLTSVRALQSVTESAYRTLRDSLNRGEKERAEHEYRKIAIASGKTRVLLTEAQQCDQGQAVQPGQTLVNLLSELVSEEELTSILDELAMDSLDVGVYDPPSVSPFF